MRPRKVFFSIPCVVLLDDSLPDFQDIPVILSGSSWIWVSGRVGLQIGEGSLTLSEPCDMFCPHVEGL